MKKSIFVPDFIFNRVWEIDVEFLRENAILGLIVDIDNTLAVAESPDPVPKAEEWVNMLKEEGIRLIFLSNNFNSRVSKFGDRLDTPAISVGLKPSKIFILKAIRKLGLKKSEVAIVGDQIFTDILGGNRAGITSILVEPFEPKADKGFFFSARRRAEQKYIAQYHAFNHIKNKEKESEQRKNDKEN